MNKLIIVYFKQTNKLLIKMIKTIKIKNTILITKNQILYKSIHSYSIILLSPLIETDRIYPNLSFFIGQFKKTFIVFK